MATRVNPLCLARGTAHRKKGNLSEMDIEMNPERTTTKSASAPSSPNTSPEPIEQDQGAPAAHFDEYNNYPETQATHVQKPLKSRRNVRSSRRNYINVVADVPLVKSELERTPTLPLSETLSLSSNVQSCAKPPLSDITETVVNEVSLQPLATEMSKKSLESIELPETRNMSMEKPMDIVIRARARAIPIGDEAHHSKPRTVITHLVLTNFKSYAGTQEVGPFHASFSSVVGPNGSGKSNVIDSLLFVFGFRASKMRQGKLSALIHNSISHPNLAFCEVAVHFKEVLDRIDGTHEVQKDSTLVISRKAFRNNSSKYYINGSESNFTTVTTLLRDRGVDLDHKRFLILQGEVESIAQMKPKAANEHDDGLLEYLEDIIGTSKYKVSIEESAVELENLNELCTEKNNRVTHVEREKNALESQKNAALAYMKDENQLAQKRSALYQIFVVDCQDNIQVTFDAVNNLQAKLDEEALQHNNGEEHMKELQRQYKTELKALDTLEQSHRTTVSRLSKSDKDAVKFEEKKKHLEAKIKKYEKALSMGRSGFSETREYLDRLADDLKRDEAEAIGIETRLQIEEKELSQIRDSLKGKTQAISEQINEKQSLLEPWQRQIYDQESTISLANSELEIMREKETAGAEAIASAKARLSRLQGDRNSKSIELAAFRERLNSLESHSRDLQIGLDKLLCLEPDTRMKLSVARQKADEACASLAKTQTQGDVLDGLTRLRDSGRIGGFHGRLGDLGTIDGKYDVAISTACPALDNLVVDSVEVGQQCIEYLRKNKLGRANFILLNRLGQRDIPNLNCPENAPRLFDLVRAKEEKFRPAFYSVLQNTIVANDMTQANRIAYGATRWRVVTLDGQLFDKSGTMSGGGARVAKGAMSSNFTTRVTKEQVRRLNVDLDELEKQFRAFQSQRQEVDAEIKGVSQQIPTVKTQIERCTLELNSLDRAIQDAEERCKDLNSQDNGNTEDIDRIKDLEQVITIAKMQIDTLRVNSGGIESEVLNLQNKIMEIGGVRLRAQKAKVDGLREQVRALMEKMSDARVSKAKTEKQASKHDQSTKEADKEMESIRLELSQLLDEAESHNQEAFQSRRLADEAQEVLDAKRVALESLKKTIEESVEQINDNKRAELELRNQLEEHKKVLVDNRKRLMYWNDKLEGLKLQNPGDFEEELGSQDFISYTRDELSDLDKDELKGEIAILEERTQNINIELGVLAEYRQRVEQHTARSRDLAEAMIQRDNVKRRSEELRRLRLEGFMEGFSAISLRLKEMYQMITMGGNAELELVDSLDPFSEGILFSVMPPKKSWKNISNLSGGEKTLSSLALVFALHHYKPTPLYVMDEIDAALDFRNVSIVASYIKERTKNAQFIVISLRNNMFELASRLVGVYKVNHMTKSVTVENRDYIDRNFRPST